MQLSVRSRVIAKAAFSTTMADPTDRDVGVPLGLSPQRWRKGFLYADPVAIRKRPGTARSTARASSVRGPGNAPKRVGGARDVEVLTVR